MEVGFTKNIECKNIILIIDNNYQESKLFKEYDQAVNGVLSKVIINKEFEAKIGKSLIINVAHDDYNSFIIIGSVSENKNTKMISEKIGSKLISTMRCNRISHACIVGGDFHNKIALGAMLKEYSFTKYKSEEKLKNHFEVKKINFVSAECQENSKLFADDRIIAESVHYTRNLVTEPGNVIYPEAYANQIAKDLTACGVKVSILDTAQMEKLGMGALLGVAKGSSHQAKLVVMEYNGGAKDQKPVAFVGKGVTFDSGGLSLKPANSMEQMKYDMAGSAVVVGLLKLLASRKANCNIVGVVGLVENMPDGNAQRPGDVVTAMNGTTIEVLNTDAEGRLVLADALWYCQDKFNPQLMVNLATLTGAIVVALGSENAGLFSNDDKLAENLFNSGLDTEEKLWRLPLSDEYDKCIDSDIADVMNIGAPGSGAGSITAAQFLKRFVNNVPWAHLDIAGTTWSSKGTSFSPKGATGFGVRLLNHFVKTYYES
jgi:leucyl aminopeptidase